jgi:hypothetical protein
MTALLLLLAGYQLSTWFVPRCSRLERLGYCLLFALSATSLVVANLAYGLGIFVSTKLVAATAAGFVVALAPYSLRRLRDSRTASGPGGDGGGGQATSWSRTDSTVLAFGTLIVLFYWLYYSNAEFLLSLVSYLLRGEAECFYMQTFSFVPGLNPNLSAPEVQEAYNIISTPGNTLFTMTFMAVFGLHSFQVLYVLFALLLFVFTYLLLEHWTESAAAALLGSLFVCLNPYVLSLEVLDRNFIAAALSAASFHALIVRRDRIFLHGLLFGLTAAAGLRFLPLLFLVPVALIYVLRRVRWLSWPLFAVAFMLAVAVNVPHLSYHGFHSLGETESPAQLAWLVLSRFERSPFLPLPNLLFYPVHILGYIGSACGAILLLGALRCWQQGRRRFLVLALVFVLPWLVLSCQRDWLQGDKSRILVMSMVALAAWFAFAVQSLLRRRTLRADLIVLLAGILCLQGFAALSAGLVSSVDEGSYTRHPLYQRDLPAWQDFYRPAFSTVGSLPDLGRLFQKADIRRKHRADQELTNRLFGEGGSPALRANPWIQDNLPIETLGNPQPIRPQAGWIDLQIDLEKLVTEPGSAATTTETRDRPFADLRSEAETLKRLAAFDVQLAAYHKEVQVSWQAQPLPVTVLTSQSELPMLGELYVDFNAWTSLGKDDLEFQQVNVINYAVQGDPQGRGRATSMAALPPRNSEAKITLRIPEGTTVIIRNWLVDGSKGVPHRIDSWSIETDGGTAKLSFHCLEPESYL